MLYNGFVCNFVSHPSLFFSLLLIFLVVLALFDNMPSRKGHIFPLPGNSQEDFLFWIFPRTLCVIECPRKGLPIYMYLISFLLPSVSCSLHQLDFYCLLCKIFFLVILLYVKYSVFLHTRFCLFNRTIFSTDIICYTQIPLYQENF